MSEIGSITLDDDLLARAVQGMGLAPLMPPADLPAPPGVGSAISSIAPSSPSLEPPRENVLFKALRAHHNAETLTQKRADLFEADADRVLKEIDRLSLEKEEAFRKELELAQTRDSWSTLASVASYITSVGSIALSFSIGGLPGLLLGASGVAGGTVRLMNDTNLLQPILEWFTESKELQTNIQQNIDVGAAYLQLGLGIAGSAVAWQTGALAALQVDYLTSTSSVLTTAGMLAKGAGQVGTTYTNKRMAEFNARTKELDLETFLSRQVLTKQMKQTNETLEDDTKELEHLRKWIRNQKVEIG